MTSQSYVICERRIYSKAPYNHVHPYAQLLVPITGCLNVSVDSHAAIANENNVLFIPADSEHSFFAADKNEFFVFDIPTHFLQSNLNQTRKTEISSTFDNRWQAIRSLLFSEVHENPVYNQSIQDLLRYAIHLIEPNKLPLSIQFIHENYHNKLTVQQLAAMEHYNQSHYHHWFQKYTGTTPRLYIQRLRVEKAKELLLTTNYSLQHISCQVGYGHQSTLSKAFLELEGLPPLQFKNTI